MNKRPVRPDDSECCGSGCKPCIFDVYEERLKKWLSKKENFTGSKALDQIKYLPFLVIDIQSVGEFLKVYQFQAVTLKKDNLASVKIKSAEIDFDILQEPLIIKSGEYLILKGIYEGETISRSYTPVLNESNFSKGTFMIAVSLQKNGKMSDFLSKLQISDIVFWRGPFQEFSHDVKSFEQIFLFGGGTGTVPLYNIAKSIVEDDESEIWVNMNVTFNNPTSIILRQELARLRDFWNFKVNIYVTDHKQSDFKPNYNESIFFMKMNETVIEEQMKTCLKSEFFVIICGPVGFNHFVANTLKKHGIKDENIFIFW